MYTYFTALCLFRVHVGFLQLRLVVYLMSFVLLNDLLQHFELLEL